MTVSAVEKQQGDVAVSSGDTRREPDMSRAGAAKVWKQLAQMMLRQNSPKLAIEALLEAASLDPDDGETFFDLGNLLHRAGQIDGAVSAFQQAARCAPRNAGVWHNLGNALSQAGDNVAAEAAYQEAVWLEPDDGTFVHALAIHLLETGKKADAKVAFARLVALRPTDGAAHLNLAGLTDYQPGDVHIETMQRLLNKSVLGVEDRINLEFALFKALDKTGDHPRAFSYLEVANRLRRQTLEYDFDNERSAFAAMKQFFTSDLMDRVAANGHADAAPIFIVGMPRSGTTLTEQILSSHSLVDAAGESSALSEVVRQFFAKPGAQNFVFSEDDFSSENIARMAEAYLSRFGVGRDPARRVTDKMPLNFRWVGIAAAIFPNGRFVHCLRDPIETCFSIFSSHFTSGGNRYSYDLSELGAYYREYSGLMAYWKTMLLDRIHEVRLEDMVADQETETRLLLDFCGLDFEPQCLDFQANANRVRTLSAAQVRQPIRGGHADRVRPYLPYLARLREELG